MPNANSNSKRRIVVLGGGFAGVYTARYLESLVNRSAVEIVLVSQENYFVFQPLLAEIVSGSIGLLDTVSPIRRLLPRTTLYIRAVTHIDLDRQTITLSPGFRPRSQELAYDQLVLAVGSVTDFRGISGLHEHALPFKNLADAVRLRNHLIHVIEEASIETDLELREELLTFVVAGGGFSGVEVCAEMNDYVRRLARDYPSIDRDQIRVLLVHSGSRILERELPESLSEYAQKILRKRGVELLLQSRLKTASPGAAVLLDGSRIPSRTLVSTVPSSPNPILESLDLPKQRGRIEVDEHLCVKDRENVWALGDCAMIALPDGSFAPPTAQHAVREAKVAAQNIAARISGRPLKTFRFQGLGKMGSLGHRSAVAEMFGRIRLSGILAWLMWRSVYWWKLPGVARKLKVGMAWALDLAFPPETVQLRLESSQGVSEAHFEPGETVFRQGDLGDSLYIILEGEVDVIRSEDGEAEKIVATMGPGDYFGEQALLNDRERSATIRCRTALDVLAMRKDEFSALTANLPELRGSFENVMRERMSRDS